MLTAFLISATISQWLTVGFPTLRNFKMQNSIKIGPSFFAKAKLDYGDWKFAWCRELVQNSVDAPGCDRIVFKINTNSDGNTVAVCVNNGSPMSRETLVDKFLSIGESGKSFNSGNTIGGYGKAKELIAFTHLNYMIRTGTVTVTGEGAMYDMVDDLDLYFGTETTVTMDGNVTAGLISELKELCSICQWDGIVTLVSDDGTVVLATDLKKGSRRRDLSHDGKNIGTVYTNKSFTNKLVVRVNGIAMFSDYIGLDRCVVLELAGSVDILTSNRDGLVSKYRSVLSDFITGLTVDKRRTLKDAVPKYHHFAGARYSNSVPSSQFDAIADNKGVVGRGPVASGYSACEMVRTVGHSLSGEFIIKNETDMVVPECYVPSSGEFGNYARRLATIWTKLMVKLNERYVSMVRDRGAQNSDGFGVGFVFDDDAEAQHEVGLYGRVYYINPVKIVVSSSGARSFSKRFLLTERNRLLALAVHEFVHGLDLDFHGEQYANVLTDLIAKVMDDRKLFNGCFV